MDDTHAPPTPAERRAAGRAIRKITPRSSQAGFTPSPRRRDPVGILSAQDKVRVPDLVPIRYGRMAVTPFTFLRGAAAVMAYDLSKTPTSGIRVQCCGDAHLLNFGSYGTPERNLVFDVNDFDETLEAPFEWDLKRLAASIHVACRDRGLTEDQARAAVLATAGRYRTAMAELADMTHLEVWYAKVEVEQVLAAAAAAMRTDLGKRVEKGVAKARRRGNLQAMEKLATVSQNGQVRIADQPPLVTHPVDRDRMLEIAPVVLERYRATLEGDRRHLLDQYRMVDSARKVVGVGSVGLEARITLLLGRDDDDPLFLQMKEARHSVLAPYAGNSPYRHHGHRVVEGQRLMQAASDIFLGWYTSPLPGRRQYYVRQLRDMKGSVDVTSLDAQGIGMYGALCGGTLARAHARSGDPLLISGYLGSGDVFDNAIADFARDYADRNEADYAALQVAIGSGRVPCTPGI